MYGNLMKYGITICHIFGGANYGKPYSTVETHAYQSYLIQTTT